MQTPATASEALRALMSLIDAHMPIEQLSRDERRTIGAARKLAEVAEPAAPLTLRQRQAAAHDGLIDALQTLLDTPKGGPKSAGTWAAAEAKARAALAAAGAAS